MKLRRPILVCVCVSVCVCACVRVWFSLLLGKKRKSAFYFSSFYSKVNSFMIVLFSRVVLVACAVEIKLLLQVSCCVEGIHNCSGHELRRSVGTKI